MSNHKQPLPQTNDRYNALMAEIKRGKVDAGMSNASIGKAIGRSRLGALSLLHSDNISLKNFILLADAVGLEVILSPVNH